MSILKDLEIDYYTDPRIVEVLNKIDQIPPEDEPVFRHPELRGRHIAVSALTGRGLAELKTVIEHTLGQNQSLHRITLSAEDGKALAWLPSCKIPPGATAIRLTSHKSFQTAQQLAAIVSCNISSLPAFVDHLPKNLARLIYARPQ